MAGDDVLDIAFVVPESGPSGIYGPSCQTSGRLAAMEINEAGGILGREVRLRTVDGGQEPSRVAAAVEQLVVTGRVEAVTGWHTSAVREQLVPRVCGRVPYIYTAVYEGGEHTPGVFLTGETPSNQVFPAMRWMSEELGIRSWAIVGNDYVWPRMSARAARGYAEQVRAEVRDEIFVPVGSENFGGVVRRLEDSKVDGVLMFLLGSDAVRFNRAFTARGAHERCVRLSPLMDENMLMATGAANTHDLFSAAGFFETLGTAYGLDFERRYMNLAGPSAPAVASPGESCYEGVTLLAELASAARATDVGRISRASDVVSYEGPRGPVRMCNQHLLQPTYLARADGLEFDVLTELHGAG
ncbi:substrate-binding domain-containing protein [Pseudonocardia sp. C8]|uniref:substrate-binding domain-containing protein n=1 Tax=Pseudonocardia sp. C8 TaxID=2762759 RepID=UPI0016433A85|nr:substrate-binding domain-containing protein [Pseudonocardia sp. C8]MBC3194907.1 substrate-binding domain-containing protein [Pseudonocardia sp. C8]